MKEPFEKKGHELKPGQSKDETHVEAPLKTLKMTLKVPSKNSKIVLGKGTTYQEMRVEVRIYKAGGSNKQH